jgi:hypothetical protein
VKKIPDDISLRLTLQIDWARYDIRTCDFDRAYAALERLKNVERNGVVIDHQFHVTVWLTATTQAGLWREIERTKAKILRVCDRLIARKVLS